MPTISRGSGIDGTTTVFPASIIWWPADLGVPSGSGGQYALRFPGSHRRRPGARQRGECVETVGRSTTFAREAMAEGGRPEREVVALGEVLRR